MPSRISRAWQKNNKLPRFFAPKQIEIYNDKLHKMEINAKRFIVIFGNYVAEKYKDKYNKFIVSIMSDTSIFVSLDCKRISHVKTCYGAIVLRQVFCAMITNADLCENGTPMEKICEIVISNCFSEPCELGGNWIELTSVEKLQRVDEVNRIAELRGYDDEEISTNQIINRLSVIMKEREKKYGCVFSCLPQPIREAIWEQFGEY